MYLLRKFLFNSIKNYSKKHHWNYLVIVIVIAVRHLDSQKRSVFFFRTKIDLQQTAIQQRPLLDGRK